MNQIIGIPIIIIIIIIIFIIIIIIIIGTAAVSFQTGEMRRRGQIIGIPIIDFKMNSVLLGCHWQLASVVTFDLKHDFAVSALIIL